MIKGVDSGPWQKFMVILDQSVIATFGREVRMMTSCLVVCTTSCKILQYHPSPCMFAFQESVWKQT